MGHRAKTPAMVGAILAGGRSTRMGSPKYALRLPGGETVLERLAATLRGLGCDEVVVLSSHDTGFDGRHIPDLREGSGPLAAIESLLNAEGVADRFLITACDQPFVSVPLLSRLVQSLSRGSCLAACCRTDNEIQPLPLCIHRTCRDAVMQSLDAGRRNLRGFMDSIHGDLLTIPVDDGEDETLMNINTPEQWDAAVARFT